MSNLVFGLFGQQQERQQAYLEFKHFKDEAQTALFKDPVRTAL
jgi:hypothetical protein